MSLAKYRKKRSFQESPEPQGGASEDNALRFVVQKHDASHLHYDFRLEMDGVLKSWAVPKGPSLNAADKRLAMFVEDHPYDYRHFEGIIPKGNYGAGTVMVWDEGTYEPIDEVQGKAAMEKSLSKQLKAGSMKFILHGKKLKGEFALVKTKGMGENAWLLIKHDDDFSKKAAVTREDKSVLTGRTLKQIEKDRDKVFHPESSKPSNSINDQTQQDLSEELENSESKHAVAIDKILERAKPAKFPAKVKPMLATLVDKSFDDPQWQFEVKWDGYRALAMLNKKTIQLKSRNNLSFNERFYPVFDAVKAWGIHAVVDGEIVVVDENGQADFNALQNWNSEEDGSLLYYVFDLLWYNGRDLTPLPLKHRKRLLESLTPKSDVIKVGFSTTGNGKEFYAVAVKLGLEGIVAKLADSTYDAGQRSRTWLKVKAEKKQELIITGYTKNKGTSRHFSALLLGAYRDGRLHYVGKVGTGFSDRSQQELLAIFEPLQRKGSPYKEDPNYNKASRFRPVPPKTAVTWLKPELVCEIQYANRTDDGLFRHPVFVGIREDKSAEEVFLENEHQTDQLLHEADQEEACMPGKDKQERNGLWLNPEEKEQIKKVSGKTLTLTNLDKIYWPKEKIKKRDLLDYYHKMAPFILPYLKDRPQSLNRFPNGIQGKSFYQKDVTGKVPDWIKRFPYKVEGERTQKHFMLGQDEASLLYMANLGAIEMNPWSSRIKKPDNPDWCILDLDPDKMAGSFDDAIEAAKVIHAILQQYDITSYPKTSGSTGMHIYIPLNARYTFDQSQLFAKLIATQASNELPKLTTLERKLDKRDGRLYIDFLQNRQQATLAAPYSVRPKPGATVSMPLHWDEVKAGLKMADFNIKSAAARVKDVGDLFKPVLGKGVDLYKILKLQD